MENEIKKKSMLSGIQPSGDLHLGNYLGAVKNWGARAEEFDCYYFMADLHTLTVRQDPKLLRRRSLEQLGNIRLPGCLFLFFCKVYILSSHSPSLPKQPPAS